LPGIVGIVTKMPRGWAEPQLLQMVSALRHDSFYVTGMWADEPSGAYVGWAVRKNSFSDEMPLLNEQGDVILAFSGEEYPEPGTARRLKQAGHRVESEGPSYLVHLYEEDPAFPAALNGRFHGLLTDRARGVTTLFNDRYGMHRIYYHEAKEAFYFAAESKAILTVRPELRMANPRSLGEFVACGCVLENRSLFEEIHILPAASAWSFRNGSIERKSKYFQSSEWEEQCPLEPEQYYQELRDTFSRNLPRYFSGCERIAMSLTGGLDTRMIMAWRKPPPGSLPCYSFGGMFRDCHDVRLARQVANVYQQSHKVIRVGDEFLSLFPEYAERTVYLTDGCVGVNHSPDLYLNERAAEIAPVRMTGNYGGEVLRSVRAFKPVESTPGLLCPELNHYIGMARETYAQLIRVHPLSFAVFRQAPWHHFGLLALEQTQLSLRSPYLDNDFIRTIFRAPESNRAHNQISLRLIADGDAALHRIRTDLGLGGGRGRVSAAISKRLLEFTFKAEYACDYGMPQWLACIDHLFSPFQIERFFLGRHKFSHFRIWYRDALADYVRQILLDPRTLSRPYLQRNTVEAIVRGHLRGDRNYTTEIHKLLTLELIHRLFLDSTLETTQHHLPSETFAGSR
jgi:asparagine synthase (glutamine-hydrolysing)